MQTKNLFISYGRRESLGFVAQLHQQLVLQGYSVWFDKVNIPDGDDFSLRINHGIASADNFVCIMAPRCLTSPYCLLELEYAHLLGKRIIPVNQAVIFDTAAIPLSDDEKNLLDAFYQQHHLDNPNLVTQADILKRAHQLLDNIDWLDAKRYLSDTDCQQQQQWASAYENYWGQHEKIDYLSNLDLPTFGQVIDTLDSVLERLLTVVKRQQAYVEQHTQLLNQALYWQQNQKNRQHLLVGKPRQAALNWLLTEFTPPKQAPCQAPALICDYICESRKNAENLMTDLFICCTQQDKLLRDQVIDSLSRHAITVWVEDKDISSGMSYQTALNQGIENADYFVYFISPHTCDNDNCQQALAYALEQHKPIMPLLIQPTDKALIPSALQNLQVIDFTDNQQALDYESDIDDILNALREEQTYYQQHKILLTQALKWQRSQQKPAFLLRGFNLDNAQTWLSLNQKRQQQPPTLLQKRFIQNSEAVKGQLATDVFISYSRKDSDFTRRLNLNLQQVDKTTWFDQESISSGVDFETEIFKGINSADCFLFVLSPDALASEYCEREVNHAVSQGKRILTVLARPIDTTHLPAALKTINWLDFVNSDFDVSFSELVQTLNIDRDHAHQHTVIQQRALDWLEQHKNSDFLLNTTACNNAENWLKQAQQENKQPPPTKLQLDFIHDSRQAINETEQAIRQRKDRIFLSVVAGFLIAIGLSIFTWTQSLEAEKATQKALRLQKIAEAAEKEAQKETQKAYQAEKVAVDQRNIAMRTKALFLASLAEQQIDKGHYFTAAQLALETMPSKQTIEKQHYKKYWIAPEATVQLYNALGKQQGIMGHNSDIIQVSYGKKIYSVTADATLFTWDVATGKRLQQHRLSQSPIQAAAFSEDQQWLVFYSDHQLQLWHIAKQTLQTTIVLQDQCLTDKLSQLTLRPQHPKQGILITKRGQLCHWNMQTKTLKPFAHPRVYQAQFDAQGQRLLVNANKQVRLWSIENQAVMLAWPHSKKVRQMAWDSSEQWIATNSRNQVSIWSATTGKHHQQLPINNLDITALAFSHDGKLLATGNFVGDIKIWSVADGRLLHQFKDHNDVLRLLKFSSNNRRLISSDRSNKTLYWHIGEGEYLNTLRLRHKVKQVLFQPKDYFLTVSKRQLTLFGSNYGFVWSQAQSSDRLYRWQTSRAKQPFWISKERLILDNQKELKHDSFITLAQISHNGKKVITATENNELHLWLTNGRRLHTFTKAEIQDIYQIRFSPKGDKVAVLAQTKTAGTKIYEWHLQSRSLRRSIAKDNLTLLEYSLNGRYLVFAGGSFVYVWAKNKPLSFAIQNRMLKDVHFSADGQKIKLIFHYQNDEIMPLFATFSQFTQQARDNFPYPLDCTQRQRFFLDCEGQDKTYLTYEVLQ